MNSKEYVIAAHYLQKLRRHQAGYCLGGHHILDAVTALHADWSQIEGCFRWLMQSYRHSQDAAVLCSAYVRVAGEMLDLLLPLSQEQLWGTHALMAAIQLGDEHARLSHLLFTANVCEKQDEYEAAYRYAADAADLARQLDDRRSAAEAEIILGVIARHYANYDCAEQHLKRSAKIFVTLCDEYGIARVRFEMGVVAELRGSYLTARNDLDSALRTFQKWQDWRRIALTRNLLGVVLFDLGEFDIANSTFHEALRTFEQLGDKGSAANVLSGLGMRTFGQSDIQAAIQYAEQSLAIHRQNGSRRGIARSLLNLGILTCTQREFSQAIGYLMQSLPLWRALHDRHGEAHTLIFLAYAHEGLYQIDRARIALRKALQIALAIGAQPFIPMILAALAYLYLITNDPCRGAQIYALAGIHPNIQASIKVYGLPILLNRLKAAIPDAALLNEMIAQGQQLDLDEIINQALREL